MDSNIMDIKGVADYLQIKEQTVYKLVQNKKLPAIKIGGSWKVKKDHIDQMFDLVLNEKINQLSLLNKPSDIIAFFLLIIFF